MSTPFFCVVRHTKFGTPNADFWNASARTFEHVARIYTRTGTQTSRRSNREAGLTRKSASSG